MATSNHTSEIFTIQLNNGYNTIVDQIDSDLAAENWYTYRSRNSVYARRNKHVSGKNTKRSIHRIVMERILQRPLGEKELVDHIDGDGLNNLRSNLRLVTPSQNRLNSRLRSDSKTGYKGVNLRRNKHGDMWIAKIHVNGRQVWLGSFDTPEKAHEAYCVAARKHFGEFARYE